MDLWLGNEVKLRAGDLHLFYFVHRALRLFLVFKGNDFDADSLDSVLTRLAARGGFESRFF